MGAISKIGSGVGLWLVRYIAWIILTSAVTLGGATVLMLFKDWTFKSLFTSMMVWPALGIAALMAIPIAFLPVGRIYLGSALGGGLLFNLILLVS